MNYNVQSDSGDSIRVPATNWLIALGNAADLLDIDVRRCAEWTMSRTTDGVVVVTDEGVKGRWTVTPEQADIQIAIAGMAAEADDDEPEEFLESPTMPFDLATTPMLNMPSRSSLRKATDEEFIEELFDLTGDIAGKAPEEAANQALLLAMKISEADSGSVVRGTLNDREFTYFCCTGPLGNRLDGHQAAYGVGLIGKCHHSSMTIEVHHTNQERTANMPPDIAVEVRSMVCVPVIDDQGRVYGVIELLNLPGPLGQQKLNAIEAIGKTLGGTLAAR